jgi:hypothetical protein
MTAKKIAGVVGALLFVALVLGVAGSAAADSHSGTWKMNAAKSTYSPGPAQKSVTLKIESDGTTYKVDSQGVDANDEPIHVQFEAKFDGKDYPATGLPAGDHVSVKRVNASTVQVTMKEGDKPVMTVTSVVSKDGKTRTSTFRGKTAQGQDIHNVVVYDKE